MQLVTNRRGTEIEKPLPIVQYKKFMGGVDYQEQLMAYYPVTRKTLQWYKKTVNPHLQLLMINSYILCLQ